MKHEAPAWNERTNARWADAQVAELGERAYSEVHWKHLGWVPAMAWFTQWIGLDRDRWWIELWLAKARQRHSRLMALPPAILRRGEVIISRKESARRWRSQNG